MDKPADPATPFAEVYQAFLADLANEGLKRSTINRYRYNIERFESDPGPMGTALDRLMAKTN